MKRVDEANPGHVRASGLVGGCRQQRAAAGRGGWLLAAAGGCWQRLAAAGGCWQRGRLLAAPGAAAGSTGGGCWQLRAAALSGPKINCVARLRSMWL